MIARNLLDKDYYSYNDIATVLGQPAPDYPREGRQVLVNLTYKK